MVPYVCSLRHHPTVIIEKVAALVQTERTPQERPTFSLAPMEGVTDLPTRLWLGAAGQPDHATTPFFRVTRGYPPERLPWSFCPDPLYLKSSCLPLTCPQIMGNDPEDLARFTSFLNQNCGHARVDLNFGCPAPTVVGNNAGSGLIRNLDSLKSFLDRYFDALESHRVASSTVTIKTRLGFDHEDEAHDLFDIWSRYPISCITLHGRTRSQKYTGRANWSLMNELAASSPHPVSGSGDIVDPFSAEKASNQCPHIRRFLIGRGALRNPWLFTSLRQGFCVQITHQTLRHALLSFLCLHHLFRTDMQSFIDLLASGQSLRRHAEDHPKVHAQDLCKDHRVSWSASEESWWKDFAQGLLKRVSAGRHTRQREASFLDHVSPIVLSRLKMIWNSLRTSLPAKFMDPTLLRVQNAASFFASLQRIVQSEERMGGDCVTMTGFELTHQPHHDWIFSGERKGHDRTPTHTARANQEKSSAPTTQCRRASHAIG